MKSFKAFVTHKGKKHQNSFNFREDAENWVDMFKNADDFTYNIREYSLAEKLAEARKKALRK